MLVRENYFRGEQLEYLEYRRYFGSIYSPSTRSISGYCTADTLYTPSPLVFRVRFCGYSGTRSTLTAHTPRTRSIQAFGIAHTHSTHSNQAFSTAHTPCTRSTKCSRYSKYVVYCCGSICETVLRRPVFTFPSRLAQKQYLV